MYGLVDIPVRPLCFGSEAVYTRVSMAAKAAARKATQSLSTAAASLCFGEDKELSTLGSLMDCPRRAFFHVVVAQIFAH